MTTVELVKQAYANFAAGNVEAVLAMWDPDSEWLECKGMPFVNDDGIYIRHRAWSGYGRVLLWHK